MAPSRAKDGAGKRRRCLKRREDGVFLGAPSELGAIYNWAGAH